MNLLYLTNCWPVARTDYLMRELAWMRARGHSVSVAALHPPLRSEDGTALLPQYGLETMPSIRLHSATDIDGLLAFARQQKAELIDAHDGRKPAKLALKVHKRSGIPFSVRLHGGDVWGSPSRRLPAIVSAARAVCPVSRFLADVLIGIRRSPRAAADLPVDVDPERLRVCPHGMPSELVASDAAEQCDDGALRIGTISRLDTTEKCGPVPLVRAFANVAREFPHASLLVIGGGCLQPRIEDVARQLGVADRVRVTGYVPWREAVRLASKLHIFVHGSKVEGFCLPVLEAAARGLPLAVTRTGVSEEIVDDGVNGLFFDFADARGLTLRLSTLLGAGADARRRMGAHSLARVRERFVFETGTMPRMERILTAAAGGGAIPT
jgi:glycosyltransferase involved in cell wall biosynthesis